MKKYSDNKEERLDIHFRENFENFEEKPDHNVWENIEAGMDIEGFDEIFNKRLKGNEHTPSSEVWEKVQQGIPLNLFVKKHLENLMKIAAVLLCFMSVTLYFTLDKKNESIEIAVLDEPIIPQEILTEKEAAPILELIVEDKEDFVYQIKKKKKKKRRNVKSKKEQAPEVDVNALWKLLMEDDEFADVMDENTKLEILTPPVRLPLIEETINKNESATTSVSDITSFENIEESVTAATNLVIIDSLVMTDESIAETETVEPDLKIWVPLVVVEKHEIESLINIYDQAIALKKNNKLSN